jgi:hypothetical protein
MDTERLVDETGRHDPRWPAEYQRDNREAGEVVNGGELVHLGDAFTRSVHRNVKELAADIFGWAATWNENPRPFVWTNPPNRSSNASPRPTIPARVMATVMLPQAFEGLSDAESTDRFEFDLHWQAAAGFDAGYVSFHAIRLFDARSTVLRACRGCVEGRPGRVMRRKQSNLSWCGSIRAGAIAKLECRCHVPNAKWFLASTR